MLRKSIVSSLLTLGLALSPTLAVAGNGAECQGHAMNAQTVIDKHLKAVGGVERLKAMKSLQLTTMGKEGDKVTTASVLRARPNLVRYEVEKKGVKELTAFDGTQGWRVEGSGAPQRVEGEKAAGLADSAFFDDALLDPKARGVTVTLEGTEDVKGAPAYKLMLTRATGTETRYIDTKSLLEVQRTYAGTHEGKAFTKTIAYSDYRSVDGIQLSHRIEWSADGKTGEKSIQSARYNVPVNTAAFKLSPPRS